MSFNAVNAGTIAAVITMDNTRFTSGVNGAISSMMKFNDQGATMSRRLINLGTGMTDLGVAMTKFVSVPVAAAMLGSAAAVIKFESAMTGVAKTANLNSTELANLSEEIMEMSKTIPMTTTELAAIAEVAGQLGIKTTALAEFTETMAMMTTSTNMSAEEAATQLARFANITQMSQSDFDRLGAVVVDLGNNFATTEAEIAEAAQRLAGAGKLVGMSEADIMAVAAAYTSLGINVEAGGTAISRVLRDIETQVQMGGENLNKFAQTAGMSVEEFSAAWRDDAATAFNSVIVGLNGVYESGGNVIQTLKEMGFTEIRVTDAMSRLATSGTVLSTALNHATNAWYDNTALITEAERRYATTESQIKTLGNQVNVLGIQFGNILLPSIQRIVDGAKDLLDWIENLDEGTKKSIIAWGKFVVAMGPTIMIMGKLTKTVGGVMAAVELAAGGGRILTSSYTLLEKTIAGLIVKYNAWKAARAGVAAATVAETATEAANATAKTAATAATAANAAATATGATATAAHTVATTADTAAIVMQTTATEAATVAQKGFIATLATNPLTWVAGAVIGLVALVAAVTTLKDDTEALTSASKANKEEVDSLQKKYDEAKETYGETSEEAQRLAAELDKATVAFDSNKMTVEQWENRIEDSKKRASDFRDSMSELNDAYNTNAGSMRNLYYEYAELAGIEGRTEAEKQRLLEVTNQLSSAVGNSAIQYDVLNDKLSLTVEQVMKLTEAEQDRLAYDTAIQKRSDIYTEQAEVLTDLEVATMQLEAAQHNLSKAEADSEEVAGRLEVQYGYVSPELSKYSAEVETAQAEVDRLTAEQKELEAELDKVMPIITDYATRQGAMEAATRLMTEAGMSQEDALKKANEAFGLTEDSAIAMIEAEDLLAYQTEQAEAALEAATEDVIKMVDEMPGLQSALTNAGQTVDDFAQKLVDAGMSAEQFEAIVSSQLEEVGNALEEFNGKDHVTLSEFKTNLADRAAAQQVWSDSYKAIMEKTGLDGNSAFIQYIGSLPLEQAGLLEEMANDPNLAALAEEYDSTMQTAYENSLGWLDQLAAEGKEKTAGIGQGLAEGTKEGYEEMCNGIIESAKNNMNDTISGMRDAAGVHSPSTKTIPIGEGIADGVRVGFEQSAPHLVSSINAVMMNVITQMGSSSGQWNGIGATLMQNLIAGVSSQSGAFNGTLSTMFSGAVAMSTSTLTAGFTSAAQQSVARFRTTFTSGLNAWRVQTIALFTSAYVNVSAIGSSLMATAGTTAATAYRTAFVAGMTIAIATMKAIVTTAAVGISVQGYLAFYSAGSNAGQGFIDGLEGKRSSILATAESIGDAAAKKIEEALEIKSPSRRTRRTGAFTGEGLRLGMLDKVKAIAAAGKTLADAASQSIMPTMSYAAEPSYGTYAPAYAAAGTIDYEQLGAAVVNAMGETKAEENSSVVDKLNEIGVGIVGAISGMTVNMDGKTVGNITTDTVDKNIGRKAKVKGMGI